MNLANLNMRTFHFYFFGSLFQKFLNHPLPPKAEKVLETKNSFPDLFDLKNAFGKIDELESYLIHECS